MSYNCDINIPVAEIRIDLRKELYDILLKYRPGNEGILQDDHVKEFPCDFSDEPTEGIVDFAKKHQLSFRATCYFPEEEIDEFILEFEDGVIISAGETDDY